MIELTLYYRGPLKSNGTAKEKHDIRCAFHPQIRRWVAQLQRFNHEEPIDWQQHMDSPDLVIVQRAGYSFLALTSRHDVMRPDMSTTAQLDVTMLRPEPPGAIIVNGGDIDNRLGMRI